MPLKLLSQPKPLRYDHPLNRVGIFGQSGSGKSTFASHYAANAQADARFFWDPEGEWSDRFKQRPATSKEAMLAQLRSTGWVFYDYADMFENGIQGLSYFCAWAMEMALYVPGASLVLIDELDEFCSGHQCPRELAILIKRGRRRQVNTVFCSNAPNLLPGVARNNFSEVVAYKLQDENALEFLKRFGFDAGEVCALGEHEFTARDRNGRQATARLNLGGQ